MFLTDLSPPGKFILHKKNCFPDINKSFIDGKKFSRYNIFAAF